MALPKTYGQWRITCTVEHSTFTRRICDENGLRKVFQNMTEREIMSFPLRKLSSSVKFHTIPMPGVSPWIAAPSDRMEEYED